MENKKNKIDSKNNIKNKFKRTKFLTSFNYLILQVIIPEMILFFTTSTDFNFTFKLPFWIMLICGLSLIIFTFILTFLTYKLKLHQLDQFTYSIPFSFVLTLFYLSGYFLNSKKILIRLIISVICAFISIFITSFFILLILIKKNKKIQKYKK